MKTSILLSMLLLAGQLAYGQLCQHDLIKVPPPARELDAALRSGGDKAVQLVYLVPADREVREDYRRALESAARHLQHWYQQELGEGLTFRLSDPVVTVYQTSHDARWYSENPSGDLFVQFWNNVLQDGFDLSGGQFWDPDNIWMFYIDADPICGQCGGCGGGGVAVIGANDLRGLVREPWLPICEWEDFYFTPCRFVGGMGHELGHAFGLPHPPGCDAGESSCDAGALLWQGFYNYPDTYLREDEKEILRASAFFEEQTLDFYPFTCMLLALPPPAAPTASKGDYHDKIVLQWEPYPAEGVLYRLFRSPWEDPVKIRLISSGLTDTQFVDEQVEPGTRYYYSLSVYDEKYRSDLSAPAEGATARLPEDEDEEDPLAFRLMPNPVNKFLLIKPSKTYRNTPFEVSIINGRYEVVYHYRHNPQAKAAVVRLDLSTLPGGLYVARIQYRDGVTTYKFVKR